MFTNTDKTLIISLYVDDLLILGRSLGTVSVFKEQFSKMYKINDIGEIRTFLSLEVTRDQASQTLTISQKSYALKLVNEYLGGSDRTDPTPTGGIQTLRKAKQNEPRADISLY